MTHTAEQITATITTAGLDKLGTRALQAKYSDEYGKIIKSTNTPWLRRQIAIALLNKAPAPMAVAAVVARAMTLPPPQVAAAPELPTAVRVLVNRLEATTASALRPFVDGLPISELRPLCAHYGLDTAGKRAELARRLVAHLGPRLARDNGGSVDPAPRPVVPKPTPAPTAPPVAESAPAVPKAHRLPPVGTVQTKTTRDGRSVSCKVVSATTVEYKGRELSPSAAGREAAKDLGQFSAAIDGYIWWGFEKRTKAGRATAATAPRVNSRPVTKAVTALARATVDVEQAILTATAEHRHQLLAGAQALVDTITRMATGGCATCADDGPSGAAEHQAGAQ